MEWKRTTLYVYIAKFADTTPVFVHTVTKMPRVLGDSIYVPVCEIELDLPSASEEEIEEFLRETEIETLEARKQSKLNEANELDAIIGDLKHEH